MCLYPKLIINRKYIPNKKNGYNAPPIRDTRTLYVPVGCQKCMECRKQKARAWSVRLQEEIRTNRTGKFVTLTFSNESIKELSNEIQDLEGYELDNEIAKLAVRRFLERWRKKYKVSVKHWLITELGQGTHGKYQGTENIHLHGIIFTDNKEDIEKIWKYGFVFIGQYCNEQTVNYSVKYFNKPDPLHQEYTPKILTSPGIGANYTNRLDAKLNKYKPRKTDERYTTRTGTKINLPIYWRNKLYSEEERENLWLEKLDKEERWVNGVKVSTKNGPEIYYELLRETRLLNRRLGYGTDEKNWDRLAYENNRRRINMKKRLAQLEKTE